MAKKTEEVAVRNESSLTSNAVPDYLQKYSQMGSVGMESLTQDDFVMPRLAIAQAMSPQLTEGDALYIEGLMPGMFFNSLTNELYGKGPLTITPLFPFKSRTLFPPRGSGTDVPLCSTRTVSTEGELIEGRIEPAGCSLCPHSKFQDEPRPDGSTKPDCSLYMNYICVLHRNGQMEPVALSLKSKMLKAAKKWNSVIRIRQMPAFTMLFNLSTVVEKSPKGTFFNIKIDNAGNVTEQMIQNTERLFTQFSNRPVKFDDRDTDVDDSLSANDEM